MSGTAAASTTTTTTDPATSVDDLTSGPGTCEEGHESNPSAFDCSTAICLDWPTEGWASEDWVVNNYFDQDGSTGVMDYTGESHSYDGHKGIDVTIPSMRWIDYGVDVIAAADGLVIATDDGHFDRRTERDSKAKSNFVTIEHDANGYVTKYFHLKEGSVAVSVGDRVSAGELLGQAASSGISNGPHLHFQVEYMGTPIDPFAPWLFSHCEAPSYKRPFAYNETSLQLGPIAGVDVIDPPLHDLRSYSVDDTIGIGVVTAGGNGTVVVESYLIDTLGRVVSRRRVVPNDSRSNWNGRSRMVHNAVITGSAGTWTVMVYADGELVETKDILVRD
jgi:murein DD-endopeptidase MepM/ murein hydrolase activator NlpD